MMGRRIRAWIANLGVAFVAFTLFCLCYLTIAVLAGVDRPGRRAELAARVIRFENPPGYELRAAVHIPLSRFAVLKNPESGQVIRVSRIRFGKERLPSGFREVFFHPEKTIHRNRRLGGFDSILVTNTGEYRSGENVLPYVSGMLNPGGEHGQVFLFTSPKGEGTFLVISSSPREYREADTHTFIDSLGGGNG